MDRILDVFQRRDFIANFIIHIELSVLATLFGLVIAMLVAILVNRSDTASTIAINIGNIGRAVPSLCILVLMLPIAGLGFDNALFALTLLAISPILINAVVGLRQVNAQIIDAARGMGLSGRQILSGIQLPIAAPIIFAGIRTSAVQVVASATLATFIGGGGLGDYIVEGFQRGDIYISLAGALAVAFLAIITEVGFGTLQRTFTPKGLRLAQARARAK
ncbi:MAG: ABC transporter, permease protein (cluster 13, osmolytes) [uncultured Rubrobacteraceae bacterium]|uniref:ABC transporter, permease protein (Cluster 13, osmolytes) n=1 Tax=uncultured Rubrobacteraceae bacterium TaxID=349277 RepID=A0A6J4QHQ1_9ACTN|nr:MAG: ABC transporter, permease protein (cluster 13, osmolytes) [uncultured Rubrobacteraceae bacterium]